MAKIDDAPPHWVSTIAFRQLRQKVRSLSTVYWTFALGCVSLKQSLAGVPGADKVIVALGRPFDVRVLPESTADFLAELDARLGLYRLQVLVTCIASVEAYLQESIQLHVAAIGHAAGPRKLNAVGDALARPVLKSSTVPDMVQYAGEILDIDFSAIVPSVKRAYKLRCAAAHNGGVVTPKTLKDIPDVGALLGDHIKLSWPQFLKYLKLFDRVAAHVDQKVATAAARNLEIEWVVMEMKERKLLPPRDDLWHALHKAWGIQGVPRSKKEQIKAKAYN